MFIVVPHRRDDDRIPSLLLSDPSPAPAPIDHDNPPTTTVFSLDFSNIDHLMMEPDLVEKGTRKCGDIVVRLAQGRKRLVWSWRRRERIPREAEELGYHVADQGGIRRRGPTFMGLIVVMAISWQLSVLSLGSLRRRRLIPWMITCQIRGETLDTRQTHHTPPMLSRRSTSCTSSNWPRWRRLRRITRPQGPPPIIRTRLRGAIVEVYKKMEIVGHCHQGHGSPSRDC